TVAGDFVDGDLHGHALDDVAVLDGTANLDDNRDRVGIPLRQQRAAGDVLTLFDHQARAVDQIVGLADAAHVVEELDLSVSVHDDRVLGTVDELDVIERHLAAEASFERALLRLNVTDTTDVEGTHRQLRAGLTDRLGCDDAHSLADID